MNTHAILGIRFRFVLARLLMPRYLNIVRISSSSHYLVLVLSLSLSPACYVRVILCIMFTFPASAGFAAAVVEGGTSDYVQ